MTSLVKTLITGGVLLATSYSPSFGQEKEKIREVDKWFLTGSLSYREFTKDIEEYFGPLKGIEIGFGREFPKINSRIEFTGERYYKKGFEVPADIKILILGIGLNYKYIKKIGKLEISGTGGLRFIKADAKASIGQFPIYGKKEEGPVAKLEVGVAYPIQKGIKASAKASLEKGILGSKEDNKDARSKGFNIGLMFYPLRIFKPQTSK